MRLTKIMEDSKHGWKRYERKGFTEMRPYKDGEKLDESISISKADRDNGSPKVGDMIARNHKDYKDQWLVNQKFFKENYETD